MAALYRILVLGACAILAGCSTPAATLTDRSLEPAPWPDLDEALVRPGARLGAITLATGQTFNDCTSNFLFAAPDNTSLYLGAAAHCFEDEGAKIGDRVDIASGAASGVLAYSSWITMEEVEERNVSRSANDFALVRIDNASRHLAHPAVLQFGGPTGMATSREVIAGTRVLAWGNSSVRMDAAATSPREGVVVSRDTDWMSRVQFHTSGIPGDSGSGVLLRTGEAFGILVTIALPPPTNGVTHLDAALAYANDVGGIAAELVTWEQFDDGTVPR